MACNDKNISCFTIGRDQNGGISFLILGGIFAAVLIMIMVINIGNISARKSLTQDTADTTAEALLYYQIKKDLDGLAVTVTADQLAQNFLNSQATLTGATKQYHFGVVNLNTGVPTLPDGFYAFGDPKSGNAGMNDQTPDLNNVVLVNGQDFAVIYRIQYPVSGIENLLTVNKIINGISISQTNLSSFGNPQAPPGCCCTQVAGGTAFPPISATDCVLPTGKLLPPFIYCSYLIPNPSSTCSQFYACQGTFFSNLFSGQLFGPLINMFKCWFTNFIQKLTDSIHKAQQSVIDAWNGWT